MPETKSEEKKPFQKPLETASKDKVEPLVFTLSSGGVFKVYVDKVGYAWESHGKSGQADRVRVSIGKLDSNGDIIGRKRQINFPSDFTKEDFSKIFKAVVEVKDKPLVKA